MKSLKAESMTGYNFNKFVFIYLLINQSLSRRLSMEKHCRQLFGVAVALRIQEREKTKELVRERERNCCAWTYWHHSKRRLCCLPHPSVKARESQSWAACSQHWERGKDISLFAGYVRPSTKAKVAQFYQQSYILLLSGLASAIVSDVAVTSWPQESILMDPANRGWPHEMANIYSWGVACGSFTMVSVIRDLEVRVAICLITWQWGVGTQRPSAWI